MIDSACIEHKEVIRTMSLSSSYKEALAVHDVSGNA